MQWEEPTLIVNMDSCELARKVLGKRCCIRCGESEADVRRLRTKCTTWRTYHGNHKYK